ncbi:zincin-like metallopeptidase domain-containing protein [Sphingobium fuliginis]|uniref:Antirestriction protein n=1 Tax=Sphingobium fuliginis (strain ATCC 27551) TaxID=336203 RepID=A0A292ZE09_SPHSA|nr:zincin-like metallopeptidase domain-containing protein [Sphingobium fuliginis]GAY22962.1 antirestriction protein [Sphingobium fuliginis]
MIRAPKICGGSHIRAGLSGYVAELSAALVGADVGLPTTHLDDHAAYIGSWLSILRRDNRALLTAAARAEEAAGYLLRATGLAREDVDEQAAA